MKKLTCSFCVILLFVILLSGCSNAMSLEEGTYQIENFTIDGMKVDLFKLSVIEGKNVTEPTNYIYIDGVEYRFELLLIIEGKKEQIRYADGNYIGGEIAYTFIMEEEILKMTGKVKRDKEGRYIDAKLCIGLYNPMYENVKIYFLG